jgi:peptide/nickel transport system ATP-binding protein
MTPDKTPLLEVSGLRVSFTTDDGMLTAVNEGDFRIDSGETLGLVGESGCGKSVTALSILRLLPVPMAHIEKGRILLQGRDVLTLPMAQMRTIRGGRIGMIFQEPMTALSPLHRIGDQMVEAIQFHQPLSNKEAWSLSTEWLRKVGIPDAEERMYAYPFQLSGGMRQRVMIAMAMMPNPALLIADEPTTALDVTIQAQIFELIRTIRKQDTALLLITHNMGVVRENCTRTAVMYAGEIVETAATPALFRHPIHPYTEALMAAIPRLAGPTRKRLPTLPGQVPSAGKLPAGCRFCERCPIAITRCTIEHPQMEEAAPGRFVRCWRAAERLPPNLAGGQP